MKVVLFTASNETTMFSLKAYCKVKNDALKIMKRQKKYEDIVINKTELKYGMMIILPQSDEKNSKLNC